MTLVPNPDDADDVLQQSDLLLGKEFNASRTGTNVTARAVLHEAQRQRRRQVRDRLKFGDASSESVSLGAATAEAVDGLPEQEARPAECVDRLRPAHRDVLRGRYTDGWMVERMPATFNRSAEAICSVLSPIETHPAGAASVRGRRGVTAVKDRGRNNFPVERRPGRPGCEHR